MPAHGDVIGAVAADPDIAVLAVYGLTEPVIDLPSVVAAMFASWNPLMSLLRLLVILGKRSVDTISSASTNSIDGK